MRKLSSFNIIAVILIIVGGIFLLENYGIISGVSMLWPILPFIMGAGFCILYFKGKRKDNILMGLGSLILVNSLFFFYLNIAGWRSLAYLWPIFMILLGISFTVTYAFARMKVLMYLAVFLVMLGVSFILVFAVSTTLWPITLVLAGVSFIIINVFDHVVKSIGAAHAKK